MSTPENLHVYAINDGTGIKNRLTWDSIVYADQYKIKVVYKDAEDVVIDTIVELIDAWGVNSFDMSTLTGVPEVYESYDVYVYAIGTSETSNVYMDSASSVCAKKQLPTVQGEINIDANNNANTYTISWNKVKNAKGYRIYISHNNEDSLTIDDTIFYEADGEDSTKITVNFDQTTTDGTSIWNIGSNYIKIVAQAEQDSDYENSAVRKAEQSLIKLQTPNFSVSKGQLVWNAVDDAQNYVLDFCNGVKYEIEQVQGKQTYSYEPTAEDFKGMSTCQAFIYVTNSSSDYIIKSQNSTKLDLNRYGTIDKACLSVADGNLSWRNEEGKTLDTTGMSIATDTVEVRIMRTADNQELKRLNAGGGSLNLTSALKDVDGDGFYSFSLRAINTNSSGTFDINGGWSEPIKTYQMQAPSNLRISEGVLTWDAYVDENVGQYNTAIRYVLKLGEAELVDVDLGITTTSTILQNLTSNKNYAISIQTRVLSNKGGSIMVVGSEDTYLINSEYSAEKKIRLLAKPINLDIRSYTLSWSASSTSINRYIVSLYKDGEVDPIAVEDNVVPEDRYNPSIDFSSSVFSDSLVLAGNYQFVVQAWGDNEESLSSYVSDGIEICKLETPVITVSNSGVITWSNSYATLGGVTEPINDFYLLIKNQATNATKELRLNTNSTILSNLSEAGEDLWCGDSNPISITIQALNDGKNKIYNSDRAVYVCNSDEIINSGEETITPKVVVYKLPKVSADSFEVSSNQIKWATNRYVSGTQLEYNVMIYQKSNTTKDQLVVQTKVTSDDNGAYYNIPANWTGGIYYIKVQQIGYQTQYNAEGSTPEYTKRLTSEYSDAVYFDRFAEPAGVYLTADENDNPVIAWNVVNESENSMYKVTLHKYDENYQITEENTLTYFVDYDASKLGKYSLNLYDLATLDKDNKHILELAEGKYFGEYQLYINTVCKIDSGTGSAVTSVTGADGIKYLLMESRVSKKQAMMIYQAPTIDVSGNSIKVINPNTSSRGVQLTLQALKESGSEYVVDSSIAEKKFLLSSTAEFYEINDAILTPGVVYQVSTQALGNSANLVSSPKVISDMVVTKLGRLQANGVAPTYTQGMLDNQTSFDGWFVMDGKVAWNNVTGAGGYKIYMTAQGVTKLVSEREADSTAYYEVLSDLSFKNNYGAFTMQFEVMGSTAPSELTLGEKEVTLGYLSSDLSEGVWVNKLYAPNRDFDETELTYQIRAVDSDVRENTVDRTGAYAKITEEGEFDFGIRDADGKWIDTSGAKGYSIVIQSKEQTIQMPVYDLSEINYFYASDLWKDMSYAGEYNIMIYSIGNTWLGTQDSTKEIFLTSDAEGTFKLIYTGVVDDLSVTEGKITWAQQVQNTINKYDLRYVIDGVSQTLALTEKTFAFDDIYDEVKGEVIDEIYVRFSGNATRRGAIEGYVNTAWNENPLTRVMKLDDIAKTLVGGMESDLYINTYGQLAWTMGDNLNGLENADALNFNVSRQVRLGEEVVEPLTSDQVRLKNQVYNVPRSTAESTSQETDLTYIYDITAFVMGTTTTVSATAARVQEGDNAEMLYLNGDKYLFSAGKLNTPKDGTFTLDTVNGGVRIAWDLTGCSIDVSDDNMESTVEGDQLMLTYTLDNGDTVTKFVDANMYKDTEASIEDKVLGGMPLWDLGVYRDMKMVVLNSQGLAFGSAAISLDHAKVEYNHFAAGTGTRNDPYVIETVEHFTNSFWLPELYFKLANDIVLPDIDELKLTYVDANSNVPYPAPFYDDNSGVAFKYRDLSLEGGFDGNGFAIRNYQTRKNMSTNIWSALYGAYLEPISLGEGQIFEDTVYKNLGGIITNLTVEVNTLDVSVVQGIYNGIIVNNNYGVVYNCHIKGDDAKLNDTGNRLSVVEGYFTEAEGSNNRYYIGGLVGQVGCQKIVVATEGEGDNATALFKKTFVGRVEKCTNTLDLVIENQNKNIEVFVGGIAGMNNSGYIVDCVNGMRNADTTRNTGEIKGYFAGGIVGASMGLDYKEPAEVAGDPATSVTYYAYVNACVNYAKVSSRRITDADTVSLSGGIVAMMTKAYLTHCINHGTITTDGVAAAMGGIVAFSSEAAYIINNINIGKIQFERFTDVTEMVETTVAVGSIVALATDSLIYHAAYNSEGIERLYNGALEQAVSVGVGTPEEESGGWRDYLYCATGDGLNAVSLTELESSARINTIQFDIDGSGVIASYTRLDNLVPKFDFDSTNGEWIVTWVQKQPASIDPSAV